MIRRIRRTASSMAASGPCPPSTSRGRWPAKSRLTISMSTPAISACWAASASSAATPWASSSLHRLVVADDEAVELPLVAEHPGERERVGRAGHAVDGVERAHERPRAGLERRPERREIDRAQGPLREVHGVVIAAPLRRAVSDPVLGAGQDPIRGGGVVALEAADAGPGHDRSQVGILARSLRDPPPSRVAGDVDHGGEGPLQPGGGGLGRGDPRRSLHGRRVPATRLAQRDREDRAVAVDHVEAEEERDLRAATARRPAAGLR